VKRGQSSGRTLWGLFAAAAVAVAVSGAVVSGRASRRAALDANKSAARALATTTSALATASGTPPTTSSTLAATSSTPVASSTRTIAGVVRDQNGAAVVGAEVGSSDWALGRAKTDAHGRFQLSGVQGDAVALYALAAGFAPARLERVPAGSQDLVLVVAPPARIAGALRLPAGASRLLVSLCRRAASTAGEKEGELCVARRIYSPPAERYELERLAAGDYTIVAELTGQAESSTAFPALRIPVVIPSGASVEGPLLAWP
jgi:type II secretory pathway pseudopilin PulG